MKSPDPSVTSPTTGTPSDRGGEDTEEGKDVDTDIKDEIGSGASSPHHGMDCLIAFGNGTQSSFEAFCIQSDFLSTYHDFVLSISNVYN